MAEDERHCLLQLTPIDDTINHAVLEQELPTLKSLRQLLFDGLFDHSGPGKSNERVGFGDVYVADWKNNRVQSFDAEGRFKVMFEGADNGVGDLHGPTGIAVDSEGDVYVTDWGNHRVQIYGPDGHFVTTLVGDAQTPSPWTQTYIDANPDIVKARRRANMEPEWRFRRPVAVNVDANDSIFVLETARHRLQVYDKVKDYEEHSLNL